MSTRSSQKSWCLIKSPDYRAPSRVEPGLRAVGLDFLHIPLVQISQLRFRLSVRPEAFFNRLCRIYQDANSALIVRAAYWGGRSLGSCDIGLRHAPVEQRCPSRNVSDT